MNYAQLRGKRLAILGLGLENYHLVKWLLKHRVDCHITICDRRDASALADKFQELNRHRRVTWQLGSEFNSQLDRYDYLLRSPGWPLSCPGITSAKNSPQPPVVSSPMRWFFDCCPSKRLIGVTGSKGKGTTSSLIAAIIKASGQRVWLGGNIGVAPFAFLDKIKADDYVVLELSSFQLEDLHRSPHWAVLTNFTPEHLAPADPLNPNFHPSLRHYWVSKFNIAKWQKAGDCLVVNEKIKNRLLKWENKFGRLRQRVVYFGTSDLPSRLLGNHNRENVAAAEQIAKLLKIKPAITAAAVKRFAGLEHRLELVAQANGVGYYDDSFATTPEATITALSAFERPVVLLAGGADKGADFSRLAKIINKKVKQVILLDGTATPKLRQALKAAGYPDAKIAAADSLVLAMQLAERTAVAGEVVLLSTACASFGMFKNYKERGQQFTALAKAIKNKKTASLSEKLKN